MLARSFSICCCPCVRTSRRGFAGALLLAPVIALQGCGSGASVTSLTTPPPKPQAVLPAPQDLLPIDAKVALSPLTGPPQVVADKMVRLLDTAATRSRLALLTDSDAVGDYRLQGYMVATSSRKGAELSYIWDVFNSRGARIGRTSGNQKIPAAAAAGDIWSGIPEPLFQSITEKAIALVVSRIKSKAATATAITPQAGLRRQ